MTLTTYRIHISQWYVLCGVVNRLFSSLRSTCCEEYSSSHIPPDLNETSAMASCSNATYSSDKTIKII
jgi:hypothetical protein